MSTINLQIQINHPQAISNTVRYARIDNTSSPAYTTVTGITNGTYVVQNVPNGQYRIGITPIYADGRPCIEQFQDTPPCTGVVSFSAILSGGNIMVGYTINANVPNLQVNINYPNGGSFSQQYTNLGTSSITIPPPAGVYGNYSVTLQSVCDASTGFLGAATAPAIVTITQPNNSTLTNSTGGALGSISATAFSAGSQLLFTSPSLANTGIIHYLLPDASYTSIVISYGSGTVASAALVTGSGTYTGVLTAGTITFNGVVASGGAAITIS